MTFDGANVATVVTSEVINPLTSPVTINPSNGFVSGTVTPVGNAYDFLLQDPYVRLLGVTMTEHSPSATVAAVVWGGVQSEIQSNVTPKLSLTFVDFTGAAIDPASTEILLTATFANSTAL